MDRNKFHYMSGAALFAGIMAVLSQFAFPIGAVPVTLQTFVWWRPWLEMGRGFHFRVASSWRTGRSRSYDGQGRGWYFPEPCGWLLYRIYSYGRFQRDIS